MQSEPEVGVGNYCSEVSTRGHGACAAIPVPSDTCRQGARAAVPWACRDVLEHQPTLVGSWRCMAGLEAKTQTRVKILLEKEWRALD